jgi:hypothetical protein
MYQFPSFPVFHLRNTLVFNTRNFYNILPIPDCSTRPCCKDAYEVKPILAGNRLQGAVKQISVFPSNLKSITIKDAHNYQVCYLLFGGHVSSSSVFEETSYAWSCAAYVNHSRLTSKGSARTRKVSFGDWKPLTLLLTSIKVNTLQFQRKNKVKRIAVHSLTFGSKGFKSCT